MFTCASGHNNTSGGSYIYTRVLCRETHAWDRVPHIDVPILYNMNPVGKVWRDNENSAEKTVWSRKTRPRKLNTRTERARPDDVWV